MDDGIEGAAEGVSERAPDRAEARDVESPLSGQSTSFAVQILGMRRSITVSGTRDQRIAAVANLQRSRLTRKQLLAIGIGSNTVCDCAPVLSRSKAEELFLRLIRQADLPAPQIDVRNGGKERDYRWPAQQVLVEIDGYQFHGTHRAFENDRRRDAQASATGFTTIRITYGQLIEEPMAVIARLAAALVHGENRSHENV